MLHEQSFVIVLVVALLGAGGYSVLTNTSAGQDFFLSRLLKPQLGHSTLEF